MYGIDAPWAGVEKVGVHKYGWQPAWEYRAEHRR